MQTYIGTPTSRVDGRAKVTGAAKYAGEFNVSGLAHGYVVESTIRQGPHHAHRHERGAAGRGRARRSHPREPAAHGADRPRLQGRCRARGLAVPPALRRQGDVQRAAGRARPGARNGRSRVSQPRSCASSTRGKRSSPTCTRSAIRRSSSRSPRSRAATPRKPMRPPTCATRPSISFRPSITTRWNCSPRRWSWDGGGKLTVYDKTQGVQNVQRYLCRVFNKKSDDVRVMSPFMGGGFGSGLRPQYQVVLATLGALALERSVRVVLTRQQTYGLGYRPATIERLALGAKAGGTLDAITHEAIAVTSQYRGFRSATTPDGRTCSTSAPIPISCTGWRDWTCRPPPTCARRVRQPASMRSNARWTNSPSHSSSTRWSCACAATRTATRTRTFPTPARSCANATRKARKPSVGTSATRSRARCATAAIWSAAAWRRESGKRCRCRWPFVSC